MVWVNTSGSAQNYQLIRWKNTPTAGTTVLSGLADDGTTTLQYTVGYEKVYFNGILIVKGVDYTATNGTSITLTQATVTGDTVEVFNTISLGVTSTYTTTQSDARYLQPAGIGNDGMVPVSSYGVGNGYTWQGQYVAGKNKFINGDFNIWQRGTSITGNGAATYTADRWAIGNANTIARSTDVPTGFVYSANWTTSGSYPTFVQSMELPATAARGQFAGNWTLSFWAKASTSIALSAGMGWTDDSTRNNQVGLGEIVSNITTSWARYSITYNLSALSPASTNKALSLYFYVVSGGANVYITGVQFEQGSVATPFTTASGTIAGELALCQRYTTVFGGDATYNEAGFGLAISTTAADLVIVLPVKMRIIPNYSVVGTWQLSDGVSASVLTSSSGNTNLCSTMVYSLRGNVASGLTQYRPYRIEAGGSSSSLMIFSAEL
jgi:hypothetical protein